MAAEVAKCLKLVAAAGMSAEQQTVWLHVAVESLEDIRASEVAAVSLELRRSVTRPAQIVPEIARLVGEKRARAHLSASEPGPFASEMRIDREFHDRRAKAKTREEMAAVWEWEKQARIDAGIQPRMPPQPRFSREELDKMLPHVRDMGLKLGFLEYREGRLVEA